MRDRARAGTCTRSPLTASCGSTRRLAGLDHGYSAHSMRATFITTALQNGASLEDVQRDVGHANPTTTKLYDRRGHNPENSAAFFAVY
jgi:integrase/recombinase XerD